MARDFALRPTLNGNDIISIEQLMGLGIYGDGSDGAVVMDGTNTFASFASKSSNTYTLIRDVWASTLQINSVATLITAGFKIFASTSVVNSGTIHCDGSAGAIGTAGIGGGDATNRSLASGSNGSITNSSAAGGNGVGSGVGGGTGGGGGSIPSGNGTSSTNTAMTGDFRVALCPLSSSIFTVAGATQLVGGGGGGGGANSLGLLADSAGGGGGGGAIAILSPSIDNSAGSIHANGGNGASGVGDAAPTAGGGGGGGGGLVWCVSAVYTGSIPTATKGTGGSAQLVAGAGANGTDGTVVMIHP